MKKELTKVTERKLKLKAILSKLPYETSQVKKELKELGFSRQILDKVWNGTQKDLKALDADLAIKYIQRKGNEMKIANGLDNEFINISILDLYEISEVKSPLSIKSKFENN